MNIDLSEKGARMLLEGLGIDLSNPNVVGTPKRLVKSLMDLCKGLNEESNIEIKHLLEAKFPTTYKGMIVLNPIKSVSLCSHHLLPVNYEIMFGYIPTELTLGFSKIVKVIDILASKPALQEDFTQEIIDIFNTTLKPKGIIVIVKGKHSCMTLRGTKTNNDNITSAIRGVFKDDINTKNEFLTLCSLK
ncbi:MAG: GTP cyclohydrolase I [Patescibacteria group bacterium]|jgi:GTP cyclohydrolase I